MTDPDTTAAASPVETCAFCFDDLALGDHAHENEVDVHRIEESVEHVAHGEPPV